jgi:hypothetical protein
MTSPVRVYDVRRDERTMKATQNTTLNTEGGLALMNGLLCYSPDWFRGIETGEVPSTTVEGVISRVFMSGHNDFPEFEIDASGEKSRWVRLVSEPHIGTGDRYYQVGSKVQLRYVDHPWKPGQAASQILGTHAQIVVSIDLVPAT